MHAVLLGSAILLAAGCAANGRTATPVAAAEPGEIERTLLFVGDAGHPAAGFEPVLAALTRAASRDPARTLVFFLGDNVYPDGLPRPEAPDRQEGERRLDAQVDVLRQSRSRGIFLPGNHDWHNGWESILAQQRFIEEHGEGLAALLPAGGCPGPEILDDVAGFRLILLDTSWWLYEGDKPLDPDSACTHDSEQEVLAAVQQALRSAGGRRSFVLMHHPLESGGRHGATFGWREHIFPLRHVHPYLWLPLPIIGSAYPIARMLGIASQDMTSKRYSLMRQALRQAFRASAPLAVISGHEHNLQVMTGDVARYLIISGGGMVGRQTEVYDLERTLFARSAAGFVQLDLLESGRTRLAVLLVDETGAAREAFAVWLDEQPVVESGSPLEAEIGSNRLPRQTSNSDGELDRSRRRVVNGP